MKSRSQKSGVRRKERIKAVHSLFILDSDFWILTSVLLHPSALRPPPLKLLASLAMFLYDRQALTSNVCSLAR
jgi:hypothetical protein